MQTIIRRLGKLEDRFGPPVETRFMRRLRERIEAGSAMSSQPETVYDRLIAANRIAQQILHAAVEAGQPGLALLALARVEAELKLEAELLGKLDMSTKIAVGIQVNGSGDAGWQYDRMELHDRVALEELWDKYRKK
jgi:hypothetical protein